jgi:lipopolysaccharide transport system ATP-binding protein
VLLIDEVLAVGDLAFQKKCVARIAAFKADGCATVLVSHDLGAVVETCDEVLWLQRGNVVTRGPAEPTVASYQRANEDGEANGADAHDDDGD